MSSEVKVRLKRAKGKNHSWQGSCRLQLYQEVRTFVQHISQQLASSIFLELLDEQSWQKSLDIVERIASEDVDKNLKAQALVLGGKCLMELRQSDRSLQYFRDVIQQQPEFLAAWQGIVAFHGRYPDFAASNAEQYGQELLQGYKRCLAHFGSQPKDVVDQMKPKIMEYLRGYADRLILANQQPEAMIHLQSLIELSGNAYGTQSYRVEARKKLIRLLLPKKYQSDMTAITEEHLQLVLQTFPELLSEYDVNVMEEGYPQEHLNLLLQLTNYQQAEVTARLYADKYQQTFPQPFAHAVLLMLRLHDCFIHFQSSRTSADVSAELAIEVTTLQDQLSSMENQQHPLVRMSKGLMFYRQRNYQKCGDLWEKSLGGLSELPLFYKIPLLNQLEQQCRKFLAIAWICLYCGGENMDMVQQAVDVLKNYSASLEGQKDAWQMYFYTGHGQVLLGLLDDAKQTLQKGYGYFGTTEEHRHDRMLLAALEADIELQQGHFDKVLALVEDALLIMEDNFLFHYIAFRCMFDSERRDPRRCLQHLKRCLELYPDFGLARLYMALWMWLQEHDIENASVHFEQAYNRLPVVGEVLRAYTDFCTVHHRDERAIEVLSNALEKQLIQSPLSKPVSVLSYSECRWIRLRLALLSYRNGLWLECINYLRHILRDDPHDWLVLEFLGDALSFRGNYWSAIGTFERVLDDKETATELQSNEYSLYRRACLKHIMKMEQEAEKEFKQLEKYTRWSLLRGMCLQNMAQLEIKKAEDAFASYSPMTAVEACQNAVDLLTRAIHCGNRSALVWSLFGDTCLLMRHIQPKVSMDDSAPTSSPVTLLLERFLWDGTTTTTTNAADTTTSKVELNVRQILYLATICYAVAIDDKRTSARLWERLAVAYWYLAQRVDHSGNDEDGAIKWMKRSRLALREMLLRNPHNPWLWTTAGLIIGSPLALKLNGGKSAGDAARMVTHSLTLFRQMNINPTSTAWSWTCLGYLYLNRGCCMAAHQMLVRAQNCDPQFAEAWLGQAWCAEETGHTLEAMDLCRHTCSLQLMGKAMRRYGEWVVWIINSQDMQNVQYRKMQQEILIRLEAVSTALDYLEQYIGMHGVSDDGKMCMIMSVLYEWNGLYRNGLSYARTAWDQLNVALSDQSRDFSSRSQLLHRHQHATLNLARLLCETDDYEGSLDLMSSIESEPDISTLLLLSIVHYRLGNYDAYESVLELLEEMMIGVTLGDEDVDHQKDTQADVQRDMRVRIQLLMVMATLYQLLSPDTLQQDGPAERLRDKCVAFVNTLEEWSADGIDDVDGSKLALQGACLLALITTCCGRLLPNYQHDDQESCLNQHMDKLLHRYELSSAYAHHDGPFSLYVLANRLLASNKGLLQVNSSVRDVTRLIYHHPERSDLRRELLDAVLKSTIEGSARMDYEEMLNRMPLMEQCAERALLFNQRACAYAPPSSAASSSSQESSGQGTGSSPSISVKAHCQPDVNLWHLLYRISSQLPTESLDGSSQIGGSVFTYVHQKARHLFPTCFSIAPLGQDDAR